MKIKYILPLMAVSVLAGCATWVGTNFDTYVQNHGVPTSSYTLQNGNTIYSYKTPCPDTNNYWKEYNIEVDQQNIIVKQTYIKTCPYTQKQTNTKNDKDDPKVIKVLDALFPSEQ